MMSHLTSTQDKMTFPQEFTKTSQHCLHTYSSQNIQENSRTRCLTLPMPRSSAGQHKGADISCDDTYKPAYPVPTPRPNLGNLLLGHTDTRQTLKNLETFTKGTDIYE